jgi:hypothetical protein
MRNMTRRMGCCAAGALALALGTSAIAADVEERTLTIKDHAFSPPRCASRRTPRPS